ncbi:ethanolamine ammonia-lyase subunit EutC [Paenibacillus sp. MZ04-78.2]|uniref:ethanolamine ammonia-lyase subunit EutC n=1 Tax=Paenibacillus sp. MZ04-78.2 TaxID=2962034 RepID=UPI0020B79135|nr:ethanolamine ammonia-lyase subunit EutC [Paenibacillus sp. MZ04-78.2]MCP3772663.1 ethanolamine ammonia-lyase subunit EutC [Paenibacillus sp. MZ04-78.2]
MTISLDRLVDQVMAELEKKLGAGTVGLPGEKDAPASKGTADAVDSRQTKEDTGSSTVGGSQEHARQFPAMDNDSLAEEPGALGFGVEAAYHVPNPKWAEGMDELLASTPARIGVWRAGTRPLTREMLKFRCDHAAAVDSIYGEVNQAVLDEFGMLTVETRYGNTENYLKRPDMGRIVTDEGVELIRKKCVMKPQVQVVVSDGLSANAVDANLRDVYPSLLDSLEAYGLKAGTPFFVRGGRVAVMDQIGELLQPEVLVLLIGERPGLVSSKSMSAYMCFRPRQGTVESDRTVVSNIHRGGTPPVEAGAHIGTILKKMIEQQASGVRLEI